MKTNWSTPNRNSTCEPSPVRIPLLFIAFLALAPFCSKLHAVNIATQGSGIIGVHNGIDGQEGSTYEHVGTAANINDTDLTTRVDTWGASGPFPGFDFSYVGILWTETRQDPVSRVRLTLATFSSGGWFGPPGISPGEGGILAVEPTNYLSAPVVQVSTDWGITWSNVETTTTYIARMTGHGIGGGNNPYASSKDVTFALNRAARGINGIRVIGENGGDGDNGFLGVFELEVETLSEDSDNDGMDDGWEREHGLSVGTDDSGDDRDADGATNWQEFVALANPGNPDSDGDGLSDGVELNIHRSEPTIADSDGDGLPDGLEVNTTLTNPKLTDTDRDTLSDWAEIYQYGTNPRSTDTDADGFSDNIEVRLRSDPTLAASIPANLAPAGTAIIGTSTHLHPSNAGEGEVYGETPHANSGVPGNINDGSYNTQVNTWGRNDPYAYAGVVWPTPRPQTIDRIELTLAVYFDGGWFGPGGKTPGSNSHLRHSANEVDNFLIEPVVQITSDGENWTSIESRSNYLEVGDGHPTPLGDYWAPTAAMAVIVLETPQTNVRGIRVMGLEGGTASGGFLGVWEFAAMDSSKTFSNLARYGSAIMGVSDEINGLPGRRYSQIGTGPLPNANDGDLGTRCDNWNGNNPGTVSFVGVLWPESRAEALDRVELTFAIFDTGGWFGPNNVVPGPGETLAAEQTLVEPVVQITRDGGKTWSDVEHQSTYIWGLTGQLVPGPEGLRSATAIFALDAPATNVNGIRVSGMEGGNASGGFLGIFEIQVKEGSSFDDSNAAMHATALIGTNDGIDDDNGRQFPHAGIHQFINDASPVSRVDTWDGEEGEDPISYVALLWPRPTAVRQLKLRLATFSTGGWFGAAGVDPGPGGQLSQEAQLKEPSIQIMNGEGAWTTIAHTSDYLSGLNGHGIGGGANPDPSTAMAVFTLSLAQTGVHGIRIIGENGGTASGGFLGVFELESAGLDPGIAVDTDGDGQSDAAEAIAGTNPNDALSVLRMLSIARQGEQWLIEWTSVPGKSYQVQSSQVLTLPSWSNVGPPIVGASAPSLTTSFALPVVSPSLVVEHYRVLVAP